MKYAFTFLLALFLLNTSVLAEQAGSQITMHPVMDVQRNMISHSMPLPASWKIHIPTNMQQPNISGPNGIKVFYRNGGSFTFSQDPYMQEAYRASGNPMRPPLSAEQIVQEDLLPAMQKNIRLMKQYPLPAVTQRNREYDSKLYKALPTRSSFEALGTEWRDENGLSMFIIVNQYVYFSQGSINWGYFLQALETEKEYFAAAKSTFLYGLINTKDNPRQIQAFNASEQQKSNQGWAQHNSRMRQNQQNFNRQQQIHRGTGDAVNNSIMRTYRNNNASSDRMQQQSINAIYEEETVTSPYDGKHFQIDSGANQTWMNADGDYIQSDDTFYDLNTGYDTDSQYWEEVYPE